MIYFEVFFHHNFKRSFRNANIFITLFKAFFSSLWMMPRKTRVLFLLFKIFKPFFVYVCAHFTRSNIESKINELAMIMFTHWTFKIYEAVFIYNVIYTWVTSNAELVAKEKSFRVYIKIAKHGDEFLCDSHIKFCEVLII